MAKKITYKRSKVEKVRVAELQDKLLGSEKVIVGVDVAKETLLVAVARPEGETVGLMEVHQATQLELLLGLLAGLGSQGRRVELAMEPTGTYGAVLRYQAVQRGVSVYRVSPKHVSDAKEVFDGVASKHDGKDACLIAWLHAQGRSEAWSELDDGRRNARALLERRDLYAEPLWRSVGKLEAKLAQHWPELGTILRVAGSLMLLVLLKDYPCPAEVVAHATQVRKLLGRHVASDKLNALLESARQTLGVPMFEAEKESMKELASEMERCRRKLQEIDKEIAHIAANDEVAQRLSGLLGSTTTMLVLSELGDPAKYKSASAYEKAAGLNLRERSSGKQAGGLHITKRGPSRTRKYLYLAALRLIQHNPVVRAWYAKHVAKKGKDESKIAVVVAVMRKLVRATYHLAKGAEFDATKLFDVRRLDLTKVPPSPLLNDSQALLHPALLEHDEASAA